MEILETVAEAVLISFIVGAIAGGIVTAHLQGRFHTKEQENLQPEPVKVKANRNDG